MKLTSRQTLLLIALVCVVPVVASYLAFYVWTPDRTTNYGTLLEPRPVVQGTMSTFDGQAFSLGQLRGRWILVYSGSSACDEACRQSLYYMRQVRTALGKEMDRVERVWLLTDASRPDEVLRKEHPGLHIVRAEGSALLSQLNANGASGQTVMTIDPLGNLMLRFPPNPEPKRMLKDIERLLKASRIG
jgi:cytochrome oxidase Cu insertion factor (SCO1/SenC/PrrC family)